MEWMDSDRLWQQLRRTTTMIATNCDNIVERCTSASFIAMVCKKSKEMFFFYFMFFIIILFFFFKNCYKGYSLHDYKFKNTQECRA
jgi:hypothetical protein